MKLLKKHQIIGRLVVKSGLHVGGMKESFQIGGTDNPVIKTKNGEPYIPGSSLKGKLRSLLEREEGKDDVCDCGDCSICILFGCGNTKLGKRQSALIFRDAYLVSEDVTDLSKFTEIKAETKIDRKKGTAAGGSLRFTERVVPSTTFKVEIVFDEHEGDDKKVLLDKLKESFKLLQGDYLGGSGTRGYGKVDILDIIRSIEELTNEKRNESSQTIPI